MSADADHEFKFRTEDFKLDEIESQFVPTDMERDIIAELKAASPLILEGSRGTGKSFLMRVAEIELNKTFSQDRILPVYLSFLKSSLIHTNDPIQFQHWMIARLCSTILRALQKRGFRVPDSRPFTVLAGSALAQDASVQTALEKLSREYESSYLEPGAQVSPAKIPDIQVFKDAIEDICATLNISRFCVLFDEAIHVFRPDQQRQFFTIFRDLRSPYISCNAAIYPGVTSFGPVFESTHDATIKRITRYVMSKRYVENMKDIAFKQVDSTLAKVIERNGQNFAVLAYAVSGNPRILLKTLAQARGMRISDINDTIKAFYRSTIWTEHSGLAESYRGHRPFIDWGRNFIENVVLPETNTKNDKRQHEGQDESTCYFWIHRDAPESVKHALRLLEYTGIVQKGDDGIRGTRSEIGSRYAINLGCLFALESAPASTALDIVRNLSIKRFSEFGKDHPAYSELQNTAANYEEPDMLKILKEQLEKSIDHLDISEYQNEKLKEAGLNEIGSVLRAPEHVLIEKILYVGEIRARRIKNAAQAAVLEYLSS